MNSERIIKVFMASSDELTDDRNNFGDFARDLDELYEKRGGGRIKLLRWEGFNAFPDHRPKQKEYNDKVCESDIFFALFHRKAGEYTIEEFETARTHFKAHERPLILVFIKELRDGEKEENSLTVFKKQLYGEFGFWLNYSNMDEMKLKFLLQLMNVEHILKLEIKDSAIEFEGVRMVQLKNISFAANNETFRKLSARKEILTERVACYRAKAVKKTDYVEEPEDAIKELDEVSKELEQHEHFLLELAKSFAQQAGKACSDRMMRANELFEQGKASEANGILKIEDLNRDITANLRRWEQDKARVEEDRKTLLLNIDECLLKTKTAMADSALSLPDRFRQACEAYDKALELQRKLEVPPEKLAKTLFDYVYLLNEFKHYREMLPLYTEVLEIRADNPDAYLPDMTLMLNNLVLRHKDINQYGQTETEYAEALDIYRILASTDPDAYRPYLATTLNNLANLHQTIHQYSQAETEYAEALEIRRALASTNPDAYLPDVAQALNNLAVLHQTINQYRRAETEYAEALKIRRAMASVNPDAYVALTLNNLANLHQAINQYSQAETEYTEALEIRRALAATNPIAYQPYLATTLNNLAHLHSDIKQYSQAETEYAEALDIYRTFAIYHALASTNSNAYRPYVADTLHNLANLHYDINQYRQAETEYAEALKIRRDLASSNPDVYLPYVARTLHNLANLHKAIKQYRRAETEYAEALKIHRDLATTNPQIYDIESCRTAFSYGKMLIESKLNPEKGRQLLKEALQIAQSIQHPEAQQFINLIEKLLTNN
ncbi:MAG: tetratricopeptide repeat protein [Tannerella sp.]|jgi:tetratricopeptide (TPR) repeat protein|nr:tetratricopeptide repeat protein [Tannerella sp.]